MSDECEHDNIYEWNPFPWLDGKVRVCQDCGKDMNKEDDEE